MLLEFGAELSLFSVGGQSLYNKQRTLAAQHSGVARPAHNWGLEVCQRSPQAKQRLPTARALRADGANKVPILGWGRCAQFLPAMAPKNMAIGWQAGCWYLLLLLRKAHKRLPHTGKDNLCKLNAYLAEKYRLGAEGQPADANSSVQGCMGLSRRCSLAFSARWAKRLPLEKRKLGVS